MYITSDEFESWLYKSCRGWVLILHKLSWVTCSIYAVGLSLDYVTYGLSLNYVTASLSLGCVKAIGLESWLYNIWLELPVLYMQKVWVLVVLQLWCLTLDFKKLSWVVCSIYATGLSLNYVTEGLSLGLLSGLCWPIVSKKRQTFSIFHNFSVLRQSQISTFIYYITKWKVWILIII